MLCLPTLGPLPRRKMCSKVCSKVCSRLYDASVSPFLHLALCCTLLHTFLPGRYHIGTIEYVLPPIIQSLTPSSGPVQGGILVTLRHARVPLVNSIMLLVPLGCVGGCGCGKGRGAGAGRARATAIKEARCVAVSCSPSNDN